jgi:hypothetical protein
MATGTVYRAPARDSNGDPVVDGKVVRVGADGTVVGEISGLIFGGQAVATADSRGDVASTEGLIGAPTAAAIALQHNDVLVVDDVRYKVTGPALWGRPHSLTGSTDTARYRWHEVTALVN